MPLRMPLVKGTGARPQQLHQSGEIAYYFDWFCNEDCKTRFPSHLKEFASRGNTFHDSTMISRHEGTTNLPQYGLYPADLDTPGWEAEGIRYGGQLGVRVEAWNNVRP